jgi:hypothetical protein
MQFSSLLSKESPKAETIKHKASLPLVHLDAKLVFLHEGNDVDWD